MNQLHTQLPPKRFEDPNDPKFDPVRGKPWFGKLVKRGLNIPSLSAAYTAYQKPDNQLTQVLVAEQYHVSVDDLIDYIKFVENKPSFKVRSDAERKLWQHILDNAYGVYERFRANDNLNSYIDMAAKTYGIDPRPIKELWDIDPTFVPTYSK